MIDIDEIRRANLRRIEAELGGPAEAAARLGMSAAQFINLRNGARDSKTGKPRGMRKETARRIETAAGKPEGWLDRPIYSLDVIQAALAADGWQVWRCGADVARRYYIGSTPLDADLKLEKDGYVLWGVFFPWDRVRQSDVPLVLAQPGLVGLLDDPEGSVANASFALESARRAQDPDSAAVQDARFDAALLKDTIAPTEIDGSWLIYARPSMISDELWESLSASVHQLIEMTVRSARCGKLSDAQAQALSALVAAACLLPESDVKLLLQIAQRMTSDNSPPPTESRAFVPPVLANPKD